VLDVDNRGSGLLRPTSYVFCPQRIGSEGGRWIFFASLDVVHCRRVDDQLWPAIRECRINRLRRADLQIRMRKFDDIVAALLESAQTSLPS